MNDDEESNITKKNEKTTTNTTTEEEEEVKKKCKYCLKCNEKITMYAMEDVIHYAQKLIIKATFQYRDKLYREAKKTYEMVLFGMTCSNNMNGRGDILSSSNNPSQF